MTESIRCAVPQQVEAPMPLYPCVMSQEYPGEHPVSKPEELRWWSGWVLDSKGRRAIEAADEGWYCDLCIDDLAADALRNPPYVDGDWKDSATHPCELGPTLAAHFAGQDGLMPLGCRISG